MASLIAGVLWFGDVPERPGIVDGMVRAMGAWTAGTQAHDGGAFQFAIASRTGFAPVHGPDGEVTLCDLDVAWWAEGAAEPGSHVSPDEFAAALRARPDDAPAWLDGEFAYAHYMPQASQLMLGRDGGGVRPIYYLHIPGKCAAFASLLPGLLAPRLLPHAVNRRVIAKLATNNHSHGEETQFTHIRRVIPGETVTLTRDGVARQQRWRLSCRDPIPPSADKREVMATLQGKLDKAVRRRLPASGDVYTHLSGGLDSSSVAALAARAVAGTDRTVRAYAFGGRPLPDDIQPVDERPAIDAVLQAFPNIDLQLFASPNHEVLVHAPMARIFPAFDFAEDLYERVVRDVAAQGGTTILAGYGGDEGASYAGTGGFAEMFVRGRWATLWRIARQSAAQTGRPAWRVIASEIQRFVLPGLVPGMTGYGQGRSALTVNSFNVYLQPEYADMAMHGDKPPRPDTAYLRAERVHNGHMAWIHEQVAQLAGRHGLRYSSPLMDREVLEFAIRLPPEFLHVNGLMRAGLREPMAGILPETTRIRRTKLHFDPACSLVFAREAQALRELVKGLEDGPASEVFRLDRLARELAATPGPDDVLDQIRDASTRGQQFWLVELGLAQPIFLARFLDSASKALDQG